MFTILYSLDKRPCQFHFISACEVYRVLYGVRCTVYGRRVHPPKRESFHSENSTKNQGALYSTQCYRLKEKRSVILRSRSVHQHCLQVYQTEGLSPKFSSTPIRRKFLTSLFDQADNFKLQRYLLRLAEQQKRKSHVRNGH